MVFFFCLRHLRTLAAFQGAPRRNFKDFLDLPVFPMVWGAAVEEAAQFRELSLELCPGAQACATGVRADEPDSSCTVQNSLCTNLVSAVAAGLA